MATVTIQHVTKSFGDNVVLREFNETFQEGEFVTLLGPSGCGKTTMLRIIAGFERPTTGELYIGDQLVSGGKTFIPPEKRNIGMVFQSYAVWPHMNVFDNVAYPLTIKKTPKNTIREQVEKVLDIVHLSQYAQRLPNQLSGGQQQRVALARALVAARNCFCSMNHSPIWMPSCANPCALKSRKSRRRPGSPWSMSRMTRQKPWP